MRCVCGVHHSSAFVITITITITKMPNEDQDQMEVQVLPSPVVIRTATRITHVFTYRRLPMVQISALRAIVYLNADGTYQIKRTREIWRVGVEAVVDGPSLFAVKLILREYV